VLLYQAPLSEAARARLKVIYENTDGFAIAEHDLRLRGKGELLGERQSGEEPLRFADLARTRRWSSRRARPPRRCWMRARTSPAAILRAGSGRAPITLGSRYGHHPRLRRAALDAYERLLRLDKPIGTLLLLGPPCGPSGWPRAASPRSSWCDLRVGTLLMRSRAAR